MNEQYKKVFVIILCCVITLLSIWVILTVGNSLFIENKSAEALHSLGLLQGTDKGYEPNKTLTRAEAVTMIVRLLGKEKYALSVKWEIPFTDVPEWAVPYIGYAYSAKITYGISDTEFGSNETVPYNQFLTMILRMLGYVEGESGYTWVFPYDMAKNLELIKQTDDISPFVRSNMADICWSALFVNDKDKKQLYKNLIAQGVFTEDDFDEACKINKGKIPDKTVSRAVPETTGAATGKNIPADTEGITEKNIPNETTAVNENTENKETEDTG